MAVLLDVDYESGVFELVLINTGFKPAYDVRVDFGRSSLWVPDVGAVDGLMIWKELAMLRPRKEIRVFLGTARDVFSPGGPISFSATVSWQDTPNASRESRYEAVFEHSLLAYYDFPERAKVERL